MATIHSSNYAISTRTLEVLDGVSAILNGAIALTYDAPTTIVAAILGTCIPLPEKEESEARLMRIQSICTGLITCGGALAFYPSSYAVGATRFVVSGLIGLSAGCGVNQLAQKILNAPAKNPVPV